VKRRQFETSLGDFCAKPRAIAQHCVRATFLMAFDGVSAAKRDEATKAKIRETHLGEISP